MSVFVCAPERLMLVQQKIKVRTPEHTRISLLPAHVVLCELIDQKLSAETSDHTITVLTLLI